MSNVTNTATIKGKQGLLFESAVVNHILVNANKIIQKNAKFPIVICGDEIYGESASNGTDNA